MWQGNSALGTAYQRFPTVPAWSQPFPTGRVCAGEHTGIPPVAVLMLVYQLLPAGPAVPSAIAPTWSTRKIRGPVRRRA